MRPVIDTTLMALAAVWEDRSTCDRNHVGCVIARDGRAIGSGYNGAPAGLPHCDHPGWTFDSISRPPGIPLGTRWPSGALPLYEKGCKTAVHAEANAIAYAARHGVSVQDATLYTTLSPCYACSQLILSAGLARVVFNRTYRDSTGIQLLRSAGLIVDNINSL